METLTDHKTLPYFSPHWHLFFFLNKCTHWQVLTKTLHAEVTISLSTKVSNGSFEFCWKKLQLFSCLSEIKLAAKLYKLYLVKSSLRGFCHPIWELTLSAYDDFFWQNRFLPTPRQNSLETLSFVLPFPGFTSVSLPRKIQVREKHFLF